MIPTSLQNVSLPVTSSRLPPSPMAPPPDAPRHAGTFHHLGATQTVDSNEPALAASDFAGADRAGARKGKAVNRGGSRPSVDSPMKEAFTDFVGQTLFGSMLSTMRQSLGKPAYFHGGRTEEAFQKQLDQHLVEAISDASADTIVEPMYDLFQLQRRS